MHEHDIDHKGHMILHRPYRLHDRCVHEHDILQIIAWRRASHLGEGNEAKHDILQRKYGAGHPT